MNQSSTPNRKSAEVALETYDVHGEAAMIRQVADSLKTKKAKRNWESHGVAVFDDGSATYHGEPGDWPHTLNTGSKTVCQVDAKDTPAEALEAVLARMPEPWLQAAGVSRDIVRNAYRDEIGDE